MLRILAPICRARTFELIHVGTIMTSTNSIYFRWLDLLLIFTGPSFSIMGSSPTIDSVTSLIVVLLAGSYQHSGRRSTYLRRGKSKFGIELTDFSRSFTARAA